MRRQRVVLLCTAVLAAVVCAWIARTRLAAPVRTPPSAQTAAPLVKPATEPAQTPSPATARTIPPDTQPHVDRALGHLKWASLDEASEARARDRLTSAVMDRLRFMIDPTYERWKSIASTFNAELPKVGEPGASKPLAKEAFDEAAAPLAAATWSFESASFRWLTQQGASIPSDLAAGSVIRSVLRANYPRPVDQAIERSDIVEFTVPAQVRDTQGRVVNATVGISFWWQPSAERWVPQDVTLFLPRGRFSLAMPVF